MKLPFRKLLATLGKALVSKYADQIEDTADQVIEKGSQKAHEAVGKAITKAKGTK